MGLHQPNSQNLLRMLSKFGNPLPSLEISQKRKCEKPPVLIAAIIKPRRERQDEQGTFVGWSTS